MAVIRRTKKKIPPVARSVVAVLEDARVAGLNLIPLDIEGVLNVYGIKISIEDMGELSGYVEKRASGWVVGVNLYHSKRRQRFTLAHELGHICLHAADITGKHEEQIFFRSKLTDGQEREANEFASDLLIPKEFLFEEINKGNNRLSDLADVFDVSLDAMRYKAYRLKLVSEY